MSKKMDLSSFYNYREKKEIRSNKLRKRMERRSGGNGDFDLRDYDIHDGNEDRYEENVDEYSEYFIVREDGKISVLNMEAWENEKYARSLLGNVFSRRGTIIDGIEVVVYCKDNVGIKSAINGTQDLIIADRSANVGIGFDFVDAMNISSTITSGI